MGLAYFEIEPYFLHIASNFNFKIKKIFFCHIFLIWKLMTIFPMKYLRLICIILTDWGNGVGWMNNELTTQKRMAKRLSEMRHVNLWGEPISNKEECQGSGFDVREFYYKTEKLKKRTVFWLKLLTLLRSIGCSKETLHYHDFLIKTCCKFCFAYVHIKRSERFLRF